MSIIRSVRDGGRSPRGPGTRPCIACSSRSSCPTAGSISISTCYLRDRRRPPRSVVTALLLLLQRNKQSIKLKVNRFNHALHRPVIIFDWLVVTKNIDASELQREDIVYLMTRQSASRGKSRTRPCLLFLPLLSRILARSAMYLSCSLGWVYIVTTSIITSRLHWLQSCRCLQIPNFNTQTLVANNSQPHPSIYYSVHSKLLVTSSLS